jgi:membrane protease subunit HflK
MDEHLHQSSQTERVLPETEDLNTGQKSLADALRLSFGILKLIMAAVVVLFLASGFFSVGPNEQALILVFGRVQGQGEQRVKEPGYHWTFPEPISEVIRIPVKEVQSLPIQSFWYFESEAEKLAGGKKYAAGGLNPIRDGYSLTRNEPVTELKGSDYNIVHSLWTVTYSISSPVRFFENFYIESRKPGESFMEVASRTVDPVIESFTSDAVVTTLVRYSIDDAIRSRSGIAERVRNVLQSKLDAMESGIQIDDVRINRITWPLQVDDAFQASGQAINKSDQAITDARAYKEKVLTDTAGPRGEAILEILKDPALSQERQEEQVSQLGGRVQGVISEARAYRTSVVADAKASAEYLKNLLPEYRLRPQLVVQKIYQDAIEVILGNVDEKIFVPPSGNQGREIRVLINRELKPQKPAASEQK